MTAEHGTDRGYNQHRRDKTETCPECREAHRQKQKAYRDANLERYRERANALRQKKTDLIKAQQKALRDRDPEAFRAKRRAYRASNREKIRAQSRRDNQRYRQTHTQQAQQARKKNYLRRQAQTLDGPNRGKLWTGVEMELLLREDLTAVQLAKMLGRTYSAVRSRRSAIQREPKLLKAASGA